VKLQTKKIGVICELGIAVVTCFLNHFFFRWRR